MQEDLRTNYPTLNIELIGVNSVGKEAGNEAATQGRDIPLVQDLDANGDGNSDVWSLWNAEWRDVVIVDGNNARVGTYNLKTHSLAEAEDYAELREMLVDAAMQSQKPWLNPQNELDVDNSTHVTVLDVLEIVNKLSSVGSHELPPPTANSSPPPYLDCNGDGYVTPLNVLEVVDYLNDIWAGSAGEGEASSYRDRHYADVQGSWGTLHGGVAASAPSREPFMEGHSSVTHSPSTQGRDSREPSAAGLARIDGVFAASGF